MLGAGLGVVDRGTEAPPKNTDQDVAIVNLQDWVDESLRPFGMKSGISVGFPAVNFEAESTISGDVAIHFLNDTGNDFALGLDIAGRGDDDSQYANLVHQWRATPQVNVWRLRGR